jgi:hypothetical protein
MYKIGMTRSIQRIIKQIITHLLLVSLIILPLGCATLERWLLETPQSKDPSVTFKSDILKSNEDTLLILALKDASVMIKGPRSQDLELYLKNTNRKLTISNVTNRGSSTLLRFTRINGQNSIILRDDCKQLEDFKIFAIYLRNLTIDKEKLKNYKVLKDGDYKNMHYRNKQIINQRKVFFIMKNFSEKKLKIYRKIFVDIFEPISYEENYRS